MKLKLDENLGQSCGRLLEETGHDCETVVGQGLCGASDADVISRCRDESRALVTLDLDFGNPLLFKPSDHHGIAVLRARSPTSPRQLEGLCGTLSAGLARESIEGKLWIVELGRIRVYQEETRD